MNTLFDILLVIVIINLFAWSVMFATFRQYKTKVLNAYLMRIDDVAVSWLNRFKKIEEGLKNKANIESKVAEKLAERAFNLASSANLAVMHLQKLIQTRPRTYQKNELQRNEVVQDQVLKTVGGTKDYAGFDWLYPILNEQERDLLDSAIEHASKYPEEGKDGVQLDAGDRSTT